MQHENTDERNYINSCTQLVTKLQICPLKIITSVSWQKRSYSPFNQFQCIQQRSSLKLSESFNFLIMLRNSSCASGSVSFLLELLDISVSYHQPVGKDWQSEGKKFWSSRKCKYDKGARLLSCHSDHFLVFQKNILQVWKRISKHL